MLGIKNNFFPLSTTFFLREGFNVDRIPIYLKYFNMVLFEMKRMDYVTVQELFKPCSFMTLLLFLQNPISYAFLGFEF